MTRILVVDDNEVHRTILEGVLKAAGHDVVVFADGQEAFDEILKGGVKIVITDWEMPGLSGPELCRRVRAEHLPGYVYLILATGRGSPEERVAGLAAGADDFLTKPLNPAELIERMRIAERLISIETRDVAIFAMAKLAESRDPETGAHLERVRSYCRVLAQDLAANGAYRDQIDSEFIRLIYLTSPLHDIGKVGIPDCVLLKAGSLNDDEYRIMKRHALLGAETLDAALRAFPGVPFLQMGRDIAATHHERWDGSGYPAGLRGLDIPLCGRIVAVADVYDALTSKRVYKDAMTHQIAAAMIAADSGKHFDPEIVASFVRCTQQFMRIRERYSEHQEQAIAA